MLCAKLSIAVRAGQAIAFAILLIVSAATARAETHRIVVRVYETGMGDLAMRTAAIRAASSIVELAGISVEWYDCTEDGRRSVCQDARRAGNFIARIMPTLLPGAALRQGSLEALDHHGDAKPPLGFAVVDPDTRMGKMATVFHDQIDAVARRAGVARSELLGRALAHEVGHLLLGARGHGRTGIMRAVWTDDELMRDRPEDWLFAPAEVQRLQQVVINAEQ